MQLDPVTLSVVGQEEREDPVQTTRRDEEEALLGTATNHRKSGTLEDLASVRHETPIG
tara:strand:- start:137 stop:310 length:174 start_codon:yes stop_codon:yes gene_type:complete